MRENIVFNGSIAFVKTVHGWKVGEMTAAPINKPAKRVVETIEGRLIVSGDFVRKPKNGFCVRPHKLLAAESVH